MVKTGCKDLDGLIGDYSDKITLIYGEGGTGKTTLSLQAAIEHLKLNKKVIYIDSGENFSLERFDQLSDNSKFEKLLVLKIKNFNYQHKHILALEKIKNIDLIIIDSITKFFRVLNRSEPELAKGMLKKQLKILSTLNLPIIMTSEVYSDLSSIQPLSGDLIKSFANKIIKLNKTPRRFIQESPELKTMNFEIKNEGIFKKY